MHLVLIHGAWHGAWCWRRTVDALERHGCAASAPDLPGHGDDAEPRSGVTFEAYVERVATLLREIDRPVHLVGHSMGGAVISAVAEREPRRIEGLIYLCAMLPADGDSVAGLGAADPEGELNAALAPGDEPGTLVVPGDAARRIFYPDCSAEVADAAIARLVPQPVAPLRAPVHVTAAGWGSVPRAYLVCTEDRAISPAAQRAMLARTPCDPVAEIDGGHSPFLADPSRLADRLVDVARALAP